MSTEEQPTAQPQQEAPTTILDWKVATCKKLAAYFSKDMMHKRLLSMVGGDESRVAKNLSAFQTLIMSDDGGRNKDKFLAHCTLASLATCFIESMNMQLPFDSRQLVSLVIYQNGNDLEAELDISYKGFVNALKKHYPNSVVKVGYVFEGDTFARKDSALRDDYIHEHSGSFHEINKDFEGVKGVYCYLTYSLANGEIVSYIEEMPRAEILKIRSKAKTKVVWDDFPGEMGKKAVIRRAAKIPFAAIDMDVDIEELANRHFQLEKPSVQSRIESLKTAQMNVGKIAPPAVSKTETVEPAPPAPPAEKPADDQPVQQQPAPEDIVSNQEQADQADQLPPPQDISDADFTEVSDEGK